MSEHIRLQLFAEGGAGAGAAGGDGGSAAAAAGAPKADNGLLARDKRDDLSSVIYGKAPQRAQKAQPQTDAAQHNGEDKPASFEELIKGQYKQDFEKRVQGIVNDRLKGSREREAKMAPIIEHLANRYGMDHTAEDFDLAALSDKLASDTSQYEQEALDKGLPVEVVAKLHTLERLEQRSAQEAKQQELRQAFMAQQQHIQSHYQRLQEQAAEVKKMYPAFDLDAELQNNKEFVEMTKPGSNVSVLAAYRALHHDELAGAEMQFAAKKAAQRVSASVAANAKRPAENGLNGSTAAVNKSDPSTFTDADFDEIARRVKRGEKIHF